MPPWPGGHKTFKPMTRQSVTAVQLIEKENTRWTINTEICIWSLNDGLRSWEKVGGWRLNVLGKLKDWEIKKGHKIDKLCMMTFKLTWQGLHTSGPLTNRKWTGKDINCCDSHCLGTIFPLSVSMMRALYFSLWNKTLPVWVSACSWILLFAFFKSHTNLFLSQTHTESYLTSGL